MPTASIAPDPALRRFAVAWAVFWLLMLTVALQNHQMNGHADLWQPLLWEGSSCVVASGLVALLWRFARRLDSRLHQPRRWFAAALLPLPLAAPLFVATIYALRHAVYAVLDRPYGHGPWGPLLLQEMLRFSIFYLLFVAVLFGLRSHGALAAERLRSEQALALQRQAQLLQLTQQIEPHFLFNALNTIAAAVHDSPSRADGLITRLATLLRAATDLAQHPLTPLADELALLEAYAAIMLERFGDRVQLQWQVAPEARLCPVPTLALQPLLENCFRHGVEQRPGPVQLQVLARCAAGRLQLQVNDDIGQLPAPPVFGVGLGNLQQRLHALYGDNARLQLRARPGGGVQAELDLPCGC